MFVARERSARAHARSWRRAHDPRTLGRASALAALALATAACAAYEARPLEPAVELEALRLRTHRIEVVRAAPGDGERERAGLHSADGLDEAGLVAVALELNPALRAAREEIGETQALLVQAGVWPNPKLDLAVRPELGGSSTTTELALLFALLRPGERRARNEVAESAVTEGRARLAAAELDVVTETRRSRLRILGTEAVLGILQQEAALKREVAALVAQRRGLGEATVLALHLAELELAEAERQVRAAEAERDGARRDLNRVLGLPPLFALPLASGASS